MLMSNHENIKQNQQYLAPSGCWCGLRSGSQWAVYAAKGKQQKETRIRPHHSSNHAATNSHTSLRAWTGKTVLEWVHPLTFNHKGKFFFHSCPSWFYISCRSWRWVILIFLFGVTGWNFHQELHWECHCFWEARRSMPWDGWWNVVLSPKDFRSSPTAMDSSIRHSPKSHSWS